MSRSTRDTPSGGSSAAATTAAVAHAAAAAAVVAGGGRADGWSAGAAGSGARTASRSRTGGT